MITLADANGLLDLFTADRRWKDWSRARLKSALAAGPVAVNAITYAEVSIAFSREGELEAQSRQLGIEKLPLPCGAAFPAGRAFLRYRRDGGERRSPLPDFYIGAHAEHAHLRLLTRNPRRCRAYFPAVALVAPEEQRPARRRRLEPQAPGSSRRRTRRAYSA